jgi:HEAT repeat protein
VVLDWLSRSWRQPLVQLAAAAVLLALGVAVGRAGRPAPASDDIASVRSELREMRQMVTLTLMQQQSASDRLKGVSWSSTLERPGGEVVTALLDTLLHDPDVNVRLASIDALARFADQQQVRQGAIDALQSASAPMVQVALIDFVVGVRDTASIETLKKLAADPSLNETVRQRATQGLDRLGAKS